LEGPCCPAAARSRPGGRRRDGGAPRHGIGPPRVLEPEALGLGTCHGLRRRHPRRHLTSSSRAGTADAPPVPRSTPGSGSPSGCSRPPVATSSISASAGGVAARLRAPASAGHTVPPRPDPRPTLLRRRADRRPSARSRQILGKRTRKDKPPSGHSPGTCFGARDLALPRLPSKHQRRSVRTTRQPTGMATPTKTRHGNRHRIVSATRVC
jgi:hypothetical protein